MTGKRTGKKVNYCSQVSKIFIYKIREHVRMKLEYNRAYVNSKCDILLEMRYTEINTTYTIKEKAQKVEQVAVKVVSRELWYDYKQKTVAKDI